MTPNIFSELITNLPEADIPFQGVRGWISQGADHQILFFEIDAAIGKIPEHRHGAQWGVVVEGEMELDIAGDVRVYKNGDHYFVPDHVAHSATFRKKTWAIDFFADKNRYAPKA